MSEVEDTKEVAAIRLNTGEVLVGYMEDMSPGVMIMRDLMSIEARPGAGGQMSLGLGPFIPFCADSTFSILTNSVQMMFTLDASIVENYKSIIKRLKTGLIVPEEKKIILG